MARVLVVDDSRLSVMFVEKILQTRQIECVAINRASSMFDSPKLLLEARPDVIFLDILMPDMDGLEVLQKLKANPVTRSIAVIMLSASSSKENVMEAIKSGALGFLSKPFDPEKLLKELRRVSEKAELSELIDILGGTQPKNPARRDDLVVGSLDLNTMYTILDGDETMMRDLIKVFLERAPQMIQGISDAIANKQGPNLRLRCHTLKGSISNFGEAEMRNACRILTEKAGKQDFEDAQEILGEIKRRMMVLQRNLKTWQEGGSGRAACK